MHRRAVLTIVCSSILSFAVFHFALGADSAGAAAAQRPLAQTSPFPDQRDSVEQAVRWLVTTHQNEDGGYSSFSVGADQAPSQVGGTIDALLAIAAGGFNPGAPFAEGAGTPIGFLQENADQLEEFALADGAQAGKTVLALIASNQDPRDFAGVDFVSALASQQSFSGAYGVENAFGQSLAILAMSAANEPSSEAAISWLLEQQATEGEIAGSWDDGFGTAGNADATAMSLMALASTGMSSTADGQMLALDFLLRTRLESGGWEYGAGFGENVNSTALVVQALSTSGIDYYSDTPDGVSPLNALLSWQGESGAFQADYGDGRFDDFFSTVQALPAAAGRALPLAGRYQAALRAVDCLATIQDPTSGGWEQFATFGVSPIGTARAIQAIAAVGDDPSSSKWAQGDLSAVASLENGTSEFLGASTGGGIGVLIQGVVAAGRDPHDFAGVDLTLAVTEHLSPTGEYDNTAFGPFSHVEAMKGLLAAGDEPDPSAVEWLSSSHDAGDWGGADSTGIAIGVLAELGISVPEALEVLANSQELDGGWGFGEANPSSTSEVVQGLVAVGENPFTPSWSQVVSGTVTNAADAIMAQQGQTGCWPNLYGPGEDPFATTDAVLLLVQQPEWGRIGELLPVSPVLIAEGGEETALPDPTEEPTPEPTDTPVPENTPTAEPVEETASAVETAEPAEEPEEVAEPSDDSEEAEEGGSSIPAWAFAAAVLILGSAGYWFIRRNNG